MVNNLFPSSCGYEVAKAWCPITSFSFLIMLFIVAVLTILIWYGIRFVFGSWRKDDGTPIEL
jgi:hypothetical protein